MLITVRRTDFFGVEQSVFRDILNERIDLLCRIPQFRVRRRARTQLRLHAPAGALSTG